MRHCFATLSLLLALLAVAGSAPADAQETDDSAAPSPAEVDSDDPRAVPSGGQTECGPSSAGSATTCAGVPTPTAWWITALGLLAVSSRRRGPLALLAGLLGLVAAGPAWAQGEPALDVQRLEPSGQATGFVAIHSARFLPKHRFSFELLGNYAFRPLQRSLVVGGELIRDDAAIEHLTAMHVRASGTPTAWFQPAITMPVVQFVSAGPGLDGFGGERADTVALGDLEVQLGFRPLSEEDDGVGLHFTPFATAPLGSEDLLLTKGVPTFGLRAGVSGEARPVCLAAHVGYRVVLGSSTVGTRYSVEDELLYGLGIGIEAVPEVLRFNLEGYGATRVGPGMGEIATDAVTGRIHTALETLGNLMITSREGISVVVGGGVGVTPAPGVATARAVIGVGYVPRTAPDADGDGLPNDTDRCPKTAEDLDGFEDLDGCPDADNDADGLLDPLDPCPDDPEDLDGFQDDDGCPDTDNDRDRILDADDACPEAPEDKDRFEDDDGCPDPDNDGDGLLDGDDLCPDEAEDVDGFSDEDGCPEEEFDSDADGVIDNFDPCPDQAEDVDGFYDEDGCPDPDNDGDGILDVDDLCPDEPEEVNGYLDEDGCPDETKAVLTADRIVILDKVFFYVGEARIKPESYGILDAVVDTLLANPQVERIRVEGHTDADGSESYNLDLSERRALAVRDYMISAGIDPFRLYAKGFGELYPIAPNRTAEGREQNRRVEFVVLGDDDEADAPEGAPAEDASAPEAAPAEEPVPAP